MQKLALTALAGRIVRVSGFTVLPSRAAYHHDRRFILLSCARTFESVEIPANDEEARGKVGRDSRIPLVQGHSRNRDILRRPVSVVDHSNLHGSEGLARLIEHGLHLIFLREIRVDLLHLRIAELDQQWLQSGRGGSIVRRDLRSLF